MCPHAICLKFEESQIIQSISHSSYSLFLDYPSHPSLKFFLAMLHSLKIKTAELAYSNQDVGEL